MLDRKEDDRLDALSIFSGSSTEANEQKPRQYVFGFSLPSPQHQQQPQPMDVDTSGGPIRLSPPPHPSGKKQKLNSGRAKLKIRKLASREDDSGGDRTYHNRSDSGGGGILRKMFGLRMLVCYSAVVVLVAVLLAVFGKDDLREEFYKRYKKQYHALMYGVEDYCSQEFDFSAVARALSEGLVGQQEATEKVLNIVDRHRNDRCTSIALLGSTGVGKSLMADRIARNFQWPSNVHHFFWDFSFTPEKRYERFQSFLYGIRHGGREADLRCGRNLIVVDHLGSGDIEMVNKIDARLRFVADKDDVHFLVLYVFQGASMRQEPDAVRFLDRRIEQVVLRSLNGDDLRRCIEQEAAEFGVVMDGEGNNLLEELLGSMDVERFGCKAVRAKLAFYSKLKDDDDS